MTVFFLVNGMLLIMFDVPVPIRICASLFLRQPTLYSQAVELKKSFRLHKITIFGFSGQPETKYCHMFLAVFWPEQRRQFFQELFRIWTL